MTTYRFRIDGIDCAACAKELEEEIGKIEGVKDCTLDFGVHSRLSYSYEGNDPEMVEETMRKIIEEDQKNPVIEAIAAETSVLRYTIESIDCAECAHELEEEIGKVKGVEKAVITFGVISNLEMTVEKGRESQAEEKMKKLIEEDQGHVVITRIDQAITHCEFNVDGIDCAACAKELEEEIGKLQGVKNASLVFGVHSRLAYDVDSALEKETEERMRKIIEEDQENPVITRINAGKVKLYRLSIRNIDCADCTEKLARKARETEGVVDCEGDFMHAQLLVKCEPKQKAKVFERLKTMIHEEEPEVEVSWVEEKKAAQVETEEEGNTMLARLCIGAVLFVIGLFLKGYAQVVCALAAYVILGYDVLLKALRNIGRGQLFDEHFLMAVATIAAMYLRDFKEAAGVMLFYQIGEYFQDKAVEKSRKNIGALMDIRPEFAIVKRDGKFVKVEPDEVELGEIIQVKPGERVPLDGIVAAGSSSLDTASLTGESRFTDVDVNDEVLSGSVNQTGVLEIEVTREYEDSTVARILELVENNDSHKAEPEKFITKFSRVYTPAVVFAAIVTAVVVAILTGSIQEGIARACTFLVISCPCALVISIPLSFFAGIGGLSSRGVLVKGADVVEQLAKVDQVVMDKTGTLTSGKFAVEEMLGAENKDRLLEAGAYAESLSNHPIAAGIKAAYGKEIDSSRIGKAEEIAGRGVKVEVDGKMVLAGNAKLMKENNIVFEEEKVFGTLVYVAENGVYEGCLVLRDQLKSDSIDAVKQLHKDGRQVIIISGDQQAVTSRIGAKLGVDDAIGECLPEDKVSIVKKLMKNGLTAFVGDGVNDAPVIANADIGFAMGALGSDAAIEAADVVLMDDSPSKIALAISASRRVLRIANENIYGAIFIKLATLVLGAFGIANMWWAIFADTGVAMLCVLNSMRLLRIARK